jgi:hypothetical protein
MMLRNSCLWSRGPLRRGSKGAPSHPMLIEASPSGRGRLAVVARAPVAGAAPTAAPAREGRAGGAEEGRTSWRGASGIARV